MTVQGFHLIALLGKKTLCISSYETSLLKSSEIRSKKRFEKRHRLQYISFRGPQAVKTKALYGDHLSVVMKPGLFIQNIASCIVTLFLDQQQQSDKIR